MKRRVAVIGAINRDIVIQSDGQRRTGWGGILFNLAALLKHGGRSLTIKPVAFLGTDARRHVMPWLRTTERVDSTSLIDINTRGNLCEMRYVDSETRIERLFYPVPSLRYGHIRPALDADFVLVNYILGRDLHLTALERLRRMYAGPVYIDVHSYLLGRRRDGRRFSRRPAGWHRVVACADFLQVNQAEFTVLAQQAVSKSAVRTWASHILTPLRCRVLMVTLGAEGAIIAQRHGPSWRVFAVPATRRPASVDPTGAGDTFTGAWIARWLQTRDVSVAARFAARAAARPARPPI